MAEPSDTTLALQSVGLCLGTSAEATRIAIEEI